MELAVGFAFSRAPLKRVSLTIVFLIATAVESLAATVNWKAAVSGAWTNAANWNPAQVPGPADTAVMALAGTYTVTLSGDASIASLSLGGPSGAQTLVINGGRLAVTTGGTVANRGTLIAANATLNGKLRVASGGRLELTGTGQKTLEQFSLLNEGTLSWDAGPVGYAFGSAGTVITNAGLWEISAESSFNYGFGGAMPIVRNTGTLRKNAATGTTSFNNLIFENSGTVEVQQGQLEFVSGAGAIAGNWSAGTGASIRFRNGSQTNLTAANFTGTATFESGTLHLGGAVQPTGLRLLGGTLRLLPSFQGGAITNLTMEGIALVGTNRVTGLLVANNSTLAGNLLIAPTGQLDLGGTGQKTLEQLNLLNEGTMRWLSGTVGYAFGSAGTTITNAGLWEISSDQTWSYGFGGAVPNLRNTGILTKTAASGTTGFNNLNFENSGTVSVEQGVIEISGGAGLIGGNWSAAGGASIRFRNGAQTNLTTATFTGAAAFESGTLSLGGTVQPAGLSLTGGALQLLPTFQGGAITNLTLQGIALTGTNRVTGLLVANNATLSGNLVVAPGGQLDLSGTGQKTLDKLKLLNEGTVRWLAGPVGYAFGSASTVITNAGLWEIAVDQTWSYGFGGEMPVFRNSGLLFKTAAAGTTAFNNLIFENLGSVDVQQGNIEVNGGAGLISGIWSAAEGASVRFRNGTFTNFTNASFTGSASFQSGTLALGGTDQPSGLSLVGGTLQLLPSFQGGVITNLNLNGITLVGTNRVAGLLVANNATLAGNLVIEPSGQLDLTGSGQKTLDRLNLLNEGTVRWLNGPVGYAFGSAGTVITNAGLWEVASDFPWSFGFGGNLPEFRNAGLLFKSAGSGTTAYNNLIFENTGAVDVQQGQLEFNGGTGAIGGNWSTVAGGSLRFRNGSWTNLTPADFTGPAQFQSGTLTLGGISQPSGLLLTGGTLQLLPSFQSGVITSLTLDGIGLVGTNRVTGMLVANNATLGGHLVIASTAQLELTGSGQKTLDHLNLLNEGIVRWSAGSVGYAFGSADTVITNAGLWEIASDGAWSYGFGGPIPTIRNTGFILKTAGGGTTTINNVIFENAGQIEATQGNLFLPTDVNLTQGIIRLSGGTIGVNSGFTVSGGRVEGSGGVLGPTFTAGVISPGAPGPGRLRVSPGLQLNPGAVLQIDVAGTAPGTQHDQLQVFGPVVLNNATLDITAVTGMDIGQSVILIDNDGNEPVQGTFAGLAEGALFDVGPWFFRIRYFAGSGNDVALVRDSGGVVLTPQKLLPDGSYRVLGLGTNFVTYAIEASTNMLNWIPLGVVPSNGGGLFDFVDSEATDFPMRYYRATGP